MDFVALVATPVHLQKNLSEMDFVVLWVMNVRLLKCISVIILVMPGTLLKHLAVMCFGSLLLIQAHLSAILLLMHVRLLQHALAKNCAAPLLMRFVLLNCHSAMELVELLVMTVALRQRFLGKD